MKNRSILVAAFCACILRANVGAQEPTKQLTLHVNEGRPIAAAVRLLNEQHPIIVTYEDPRYSFQADIKDVTAEVRNPRAPLNSAAKVLVPRGGSLIVDYMASGKTNELISPSETLQQIVNSAEFNGTGGLFEIQQSGGAFHVVPRAIRNAGGLWIEQGSILEARITLPSQQMNGFQMISAFCAALSEATGTYVHVGVVPLNSFNRHRGLVAANNERARDVLMRILESIGGRLTWQLLYDPGGKFGYALNISGVAFRPESQPSAEQLPSLRSGSTPAGPIVRE